MFLAEINIEDVTSLIKSGDGANIWTVIITIISVLGGVKAWDYYTKRAELKSKDRHKDRQNTKDEREFYTDNLKERVTMLEEKLDKITLQKDELLNMISELKVRNATLEVRLQSKIVKSRGKTKD